LKEVDEARVYEREEQAITHFYERESGLVQVNKFFIEF
jgi:hypothetical protein